MALIFLGLTECVLCGKTLQKGEKVSSLPPIGDKENALYKYFDAGLHTHCFETWDKKEEVLGVIKVENQKFLNSDYFKDKISKFGRPKWLDEMEQGFQPFAGGSV
jgi:hypothetical protein